jgi:polysaccharide pyruvyl transferase WcaK-like protein
MMRHFGPKWLWKRSRRRRRWLNCPAIMVQYDRNTFSIMRILHTYCLNYNIGDYALGIGLKNLLRHYLKVDLIGNTNIQGREFNTYYINEVVNKKYDLLVLGGGGIIHGAHWPNGWFWLIQEDLIKTIKIPFIVYGVGNNYWKEEREMPARAFEHIDETIKRATFFSVRNDGSADRLKGKIKNFHLIHTVPDPGFHVNLNTEYQRKIDDPYVLIQLANDKSDIRFRGQNGKAKFVKNLREIIKNLSKRYRIVFSPHVLEDIELSHEVAKGICNTEIWDFGYLAFDHLQDAIAYYKYAKFVVSMRGHGQIIPISFNSPVITLGNHPKHMGLMKELNLLEYYVDISNKELVSSILEIIKKIEEDYFALKSKLISLNKILMKNSEDSFKIIVGKIK